MEDTTSKKAFRVELLLLRKGISGSLRLEKNLEISKRFIQSDRFQNAQTIHFYLANRSEVETDPLIREALRLKKRVAVPVIDPSRQSLSFSELSHLDPDTLEMGPYNIPQPLSSFQKKMTINEIDLWVIPGLGFDLRGNRLGYGKGYYDRTLEHIKKPIIGLAFDCQILDRLPVGPTDRAVDQIITETRTIFCNLNPASGPSTEGAEQGFRQGDKRSGAQE